MRRWDARRRRHGSGRLWPGGLAGRVALILIAALLVVLAVGVLFVFQDRAPSRLERFAEAFARQVVGIVELIEATPPSRRAGLLRAVSGPIMRVDLAARRPVFQAEEWRPAGWMHPMMMGHFRALGGRPIHVYLLDRWEFVPGDRLRGRGTRGPDPVPGRRKVVATVGLRDGSWAVFTMASHLPSGRWGVRIAFWVVLTVVIVIVFAVWAAHRVTRPLARFAEAADRLGVDVRAPPLPETGSRELREATHAFNRMQGRLRRLIEDRTLMLAAISHDLRTVLTRVRLRAEFIDDAEQQKKAIADVDEMQAMLDATLAFGHEDTMEEPRSAVDLTGLLRSLVDDMADAGHRASYDGPEHLTYQCRPVALRRAFVNLISNAVKYGGEAAVGLAEHADGVEVTVADRGPGIPAELREKVFTPFFRIEASRSRETGGTGLGLAVARSTLRRHGGDVVLEDRPGGGLLARVSLPRVADQAE